MDAISWSGPGEDRILQMALDDELDRYRVLAFLQRVEEGYGAHKLYPYLDELHRRLEQLTALCDERTRLLAATARDLCGVDLKHQVLRYEQPVEDGAMDTVRSMLEFALPGMQRMHELGLGLRQELQEHIHFAPVGVLPLNTQEGYILLRQGGRALAYAYSMPLWHGTSSELRHRSVRTHYVTSYSVGPVGQYGPIKADLVRQYRAWPNPATFVFESDLTLPRVETFMPLAKQLVYEHLLPMGVNAPGGSLGRTMPD